jgi:uncharacterized membrane protein YebE (DUF533 family)
MKKIIIPILTTLLLTSCANSQGDVFGRKADAGALIGGMAGAMIGAHNGNVAKGALLGAGAGLAAGAIADANDARVKQNKQVVVVEGQQPPRASQTQTEVVVVQQPVIIEERVWRGPNLWIYSYHGYRDRFGHIHYRNHIPFHRRPSWGPRR